MAAWATPSTHGAAVYETLLYADGQLSCNCPAWVYVRKGRPRGVDLEDPLVTATRPASTSATWLWAARVWRQPRGRPFRT